MKKWFVAIPLFIALAACVSLKPAPSTISVRDMAIAPPSLMVAKKSKRPLFVVLDEARVASKLPVLVGGEDRGGYLSDGQTFVTRDLVKALSTYFDEVTVVGPDDVPTTGDYAVVDVKLERVEVLVTGREVVSGYGGVVSMSAGAAALTWGFALRLSESDDYLYSFAGESAGLPGKDPTFVFRSMFENSLSALLKGYTDKEIHKHVLAAEPAAAAPAEATIGI